MEAKTEEKLIRCMNRLYNDDSGFEGDIPEIKTQLRALNGRVREAEADIDTLQLCQAEAKGVAKSSLLKNATTTEKIIIVVIIALLGGEQLAGTLL